MGTRTYAASSLAFVLLVAGGTTASRSASYDLEPAASPSCGVTNSTFAFWAREATKIVKENTVATDRACPNVEVRQTKPIKRDSAIPRIVQTRAQRNALKTYTGGNVVVVDGLHWCGEFSPSSYAGCEGAGPIIVVNLDRSFHFPELSLIHEIGHNVGFGHTASICPVPRPAGSGIPDAVYFNIMYCRAHRDRRAVNANQCSTLQDGSIADLPMVDAAPAQGVAPATAMSTPAAVADPAPTPAGPEDIETFLMERFAQGTPYEEIELLSPDQLDEVRRILGADSKRALWANAVVVLGLRGQASDVDLLIDLFERIKGSNDPSDLRTRTSGAYSLGMLAGRVEGEPKGRALSFLIRGFRIDGARQLAAPEESDSLARSFATGIALSGDPVATKGVIDASIATRRTWAPQIESYARELGIDSAAPAAAAEVPALDSDELQTLSDTAIGVNARGVRAMLQGQVPESQEQQQIAPNVDQLPASLNRLKDLATSAPEVPAAAQALRSLGLPSLRQWRETPLRNKLGNP
ncbi:hypothetical protein [Flaviflagellibacter deserti]|jgi:hypothetical protein|uniref:Uncharacterized protein n=1 Tax=Flaviflagellibacter deserti TaxID=2267266 RepID=A0ABV9Z0E4_9HYPH